MYTYQIISICLPRCLQPRFTSFARLKDEMDPVFFLQQQFIRKCRNKAAVCVFWLRLMRMPFGVMSGAKGHVGAPGHSLELPILLLLTFDQCVLKYLYCTGQMVKFGEPIEIPGRPSPFNLKTSMVGKALCSAVSSVFPLRLEADGAGGPGEEQVGRSRRNQLGALGTLSY